jgi:ornithine carbamoyltransferase
MGVRHFLTVPDLSKAELETVLAQAAFWKKNPQ